MTKRYKLKFKDLDALNAAIAIESEDLETQVVSTKRHFVSFAPSRAAFAKAGLAAEALETPGPAQGSLDRLAQEFGADLVEDYQYELDDEGMELFEAPVDIDEEGTLDDVLDMVRARDAWDRSRGEGVTIAVVDTGIDGSNAEFPKWKRAGDWTPTGDKPWTDWQGHGTMCACISAATRAEGGRYDGIAPDAKIMACKTRFYDSELASIYDAIEERAKGGERIVATNSFGRKVGTPPPPPQESDFLPALEDAIAAGVTVVFSAGNNHERAGGVPYECTPNSVWLHKSRADVLAVATCDLEREMWYYSSRGPGQFFGQANTNRKPDVTGPTPRNGRILYGAGDRVLPNGWGTSGACPQAAGLAALLIAVRPNLSALDVFEAVRSGAVGIGKGELCQGDGMIDCDASLSRVLTS